MKELTSLAIVGKGYLKGIFDMEKNNKKNALLVGGAVLLASVAAGASAYITRAAMTPDKPAQEKVVTSTQKEKIVWNDQKRAQPQKVKCDDGNVVGYGLGAVAGGLAGNQFGKGKGKTIATVAGATGGALAGGEYIPTRNVLCR